VIKVTNNFARFVQNVLILYRRLHAVNLGRHSSIAASITCCWNPCQASVAASVDWDSGSLVHMHCWIGAQIL